MAPMGPFCKPRVFTRGYDYVGKRLHTFCTPFAHLPESGAFLRKVCTACFPLHKNGTCRGEAPPSAIADRSVTQTPHWGVCCFANAKTLGEQGSRQFSAFVCVHQPDGFKDLLAGDFCCRRLFVLPGLRCCRGQVLRGHRRVSHADGHAVFKVQRAKRQQKSRHKTDQPCPHFFWKVMLVGYVNG